MLTALVLAGGVIYYSGGFDFFLLKPLLPKEGEETRQPIPPVKQTSHPKKYAKKNRPVSSLTDELTFLETLLDPRMEKYLGLDGKIKRQRTSSKKPPLTQMTTSKTRSPNEEYGKNTFAVQASSFKMLYRASELVDNLKGKGYPAYFSTYKPSGEDELWYRVFLGKYGDHRKALQVTKKAQTEEDLDPMIIFSKE